MEHTVPKLQCQIQLGYYFGFSHYVTNLVLNDHAIMPKHFVHLGICFKC